MANCEHERKIAAGGNCRAAHGDSIRQVIDKCNQCVLCVTNLTKLALCNQQVVGSNPTAGSLVNRGFAQMEKNCAWTLLGHFWHSNPSRMAVFAGPVPKFTSPNPFEIAYTQPARIGDLCQIFGNSPSNKWLSLR